MKQGSSTYRVIVPTALFGTVRVARGDVVKRELLGYQLRRMVEQGIVEPVEATPPRKRIDASVI